MTFTVVWKPSAERTLAETWLEAADRKSIANAADAIDALLRSDALPVGESREGNSRLLYVAPLAVYYDVFPDDMLVAVWASRRPDESTRIIASRGPLVLNRRHTAFIGPYYRIFITVIGSI
jgi:hypothetical protein